MSYRKIVADKKYLLLPIANAAHWLPPSESIQYLSIYEDGRIIQEYEVILSKDPLFWSPVYLDAYRGKELTIALEHGDESIIDLLRLSDNLADTASLYRETARPYIHFTPMHGFMNDPNGLFYYNGLYHYFAQLNPYGLGIGNTNWLQPARI